MGRGEPGSGELKPYSGFVRFVQRMRSAGVLRQ